MKIDNKSTIYIRNVDYLWIKSLLKQCSFPTKQLYWAVKKIVGSFLWCDIERKEVNLVAPSFNKPALYFSSTKKKQNAPSLFLCLSLQNGTFHFRLFLCFCCLYANSVLFAPSECNRAVHTCYFRYLLHLHYFLSSQLMCSWFLCSVYFFSLRHSVFLSFLFFFGSVLPVSSEQFPERYVKHIASHTLIAAKSHWWLCIYICVCAENKIQYQTQSTCTTSSLMALLCYFHWLSEFQKIGKILKAHIKFFLLLFIMKQKEKK